MLSAYSVLGIVTDPKETEMNRDKKDSVFMELTFLEHGKTLNKINKMHCILYVGAFSGDKN